MLGAPMRLEWIEDILAVLDAGSLNRAAELRYLTQPAFSRRMKSIESYVGVELLDRTHKPVQLRPSVLDQQERLERLSAELRDLVQDLRQQGRRTRNRVVVASQHSITTSFAPGLIKCLPAESDVTIRLRSANRDECFAMLVTRQADLVLTYRHLGEPLPVQESFVEVCDLPDENMVPVCGTETLGELNEQYLRGELPVIAYPPDVFMGEVMTRDILPTLRAKVFLRTKAETALTLAALQLALAGVGIAWVPYSLAAEEILSGRLTMLTDVCGKATLATSAVRLAGPKSRAEESVWQIVEGFAGIEAA